MDYIEEFVDERHKGWCIHCGVWVRDVQTNRDHVPSKSLLQTPYPHNLPTIAVCKACNEGFSADEEYLVAFLGCVLSGSADPERQANPRVQRILKRSPKLRERIENARLESQMLFDERLGIVWTPEQQRVERVVVKNARGHAYYEYGEPMLDEPARVWFTPLALLNSDERAEFEDVQTGHLWPEVGSRMLTRALTGQDLWDGWVIAQDDVYRYAVVQRGRLMVRPVIHEYLATEVLWE